MKRYEALARDITASIRSGLLKPGDRLPSVRQASASRHVSPATVFEAYYLLEAQGLIQSRPRSGYYVTQAPRALPLVPEQPSTPDGEARPVEVSQMVRDILQSAASRQEVPLGSAFPSPLLYPLPRLGRTLATVATHLDPWSTVDNLMPGSLELRRQIALRYLLDGVQVSLDEIVVTNGAMEALNLCLSAVCKPGDAVAVESPCFYACLQALERLGLQAIEVATDPRDGIDLTALETVIHKHRPAACWLMTNFQNPLGSAMPADKKRALADLAARHALPIIEDDVYNELYDGPQRPALSRSFDAAGWIMHCGSFSKSLAPGYRIGWVSAGRFTSKIVHHRIAASIAPSIPVQLALARYLERGSYERHLRGLRATLQSQRDAYIDLIAEHFPAGTRISRPTGGYFLWVELPAGLDSLQLREQAMREGISLAPGPMFSVSSAFRNCVRINAGHPCTPAVAAAVARLGQRMQA